VIVIPTQRYSPSRLPFHTERYCLLNSAESVLTAGGYQHSSPVSRYLFYEWPPIKRFIEASGFSEADLLIGYARLRALCIVNTPLDPATTGRSRERNSTFDWETAEDWLAYQSLWGCAGGLARRRVARPWGRGRPRAGAHEQQVVDQPRTYPFQLVVHGAWLKWWRLSGWHRGGAQPSVTRACNQIFTLL